MTEAIVRPSHTSHRDGDPRGNTAIVFIHGVSAGAWCFEGMASYFVKKGVCAYRIDLPGHGSRRNIGETMSFSRYVSATREMVREVRKKHAKVFVVGHSMGGLIAQVLGSEIDLAGLALVASAPTKGTDFEGYGLRELTRTLIGAGKLALEGERDIVRAHIAQFFNNPKDSAIDAWTRERVFDPVNVIAEVRLNPPHMDLPRTDRALVIIPSRDIVIDPATQYRIAEAVNTMGPVAIVEEVPLSHMLVMEEGWLTVAQSIFMRLILPT